MYPFFRLLLSTMKASRAHKAAPVAFDTIGIMTFRCRPWDLDLFMEMNNGRILTLYDLGRFDLSIRSGLWAEMRKRKWGLAVAGSTVRYRKRVRLFDKVTMRTQLVGMDDRWIYMAQSMWVRGEPTSSVLLRTCVTAKGRSILTEEVRKILGMPEVGVMEPWVKDWESADRERPWPPIP